MTSSPNAIRYDRRIVYYVTAATELRLITQARAEDKKLSDYLREREVEIQRAIRAKRSRKKA